jgi:RNase P subunit RPR2
VSTQPVEVQRYCRACQTKQPAKEWKVDSEESPTGHDVIRVCSRCNLRTRHIYEKPKGDNE